MAPKKLSSVPKRGKRTRPAQIIEAMLSAESVLVTGHVRPDGDSVGCMIALCHLLKKVGVKAVATADSKVLGGPGFLRGVEELVVPKSLKVNDYDLLVSVDCGAFDRLPEEVQPLAERLPIVNIDHHLTNTLFGNWNWIVAHSSSTAEMIWQLARRAKWPLDEIAAEALWVGLITDTGRFAYDQTTPKTMLCGADLLRYGVRTALINDNLYCSFSRVTMELKKRALRSLTIRKHGAVAAVTLTGRDFEETGGNKADVEDVIEIPRSLVDNRVAIFFYGNEDDDKETRVSVRTREPLDATALVGQFGGGGHARAAGCTINAPLVKARRIFYRVVDEMLRESGTQ